MVKRRHKPISHSDDEISTLGPRKPHKQGGPTTPLTFGFWIVANLGWLPRVPQWDSSFVILAMFASVEAIFLSTFVLISQNRMSAAATKRAHLDLQISLLTEHEITKMAVLLAEVAGRLGIETELRDELEPVKQDIAPDVVLDKIEAEG